METPTGVVRTEAEKQQAEEEARRKREEEERLKREEEEARRKHEKEERKKNSLFYKCVNGLKRLGETMTKEETDN